MNKEDKKLIKNWQKALKNGNKPIFKSLLERFLFSLCVQEGIIKYPSKKDLKRRYFKDKIKHTKKDIRRIAKKGIYYRDKIYTFDGYEKYIGETVSFEVQEPYLILTLEDKVFHATTQEDLTKNREIEKTLNEFLKCPDKWKRKYKTN